MRYQLADKCLLVDVKHHRTKKRLPEKLPFPHIFDQRKGKDPATYLRLSDGAAYIAHFIAIGVDTDLIPEILRSEYGVKVENPKAEVDAVLEMLKPYLKKRTAKRRYKAAKSHKEKEHIGGYELEFGVNWAGNTWNKVPTS